MRIIMPVWATTPDDIRITEAAAESLKGHQLTIIDNGSTFGAGQLREWADIYVRNRTNLGYAKAVNQGLRIHPQGMKAIANNDIRVSPNWADIAEEIEAGCPHPFSVHYRMVPYDQEFNPGDQVWKVGKERWCSSSFFVVKSNQVYDEQYLNSLDDWDYWRRFRESGGVTFYTNKAEYQHYDSFTQQKRTDRSENDKLNLAHYVEKWGETPDEWMARTYPDQLSVPWKPFP